MVNKEEREQNGAAQREARVKTKRTFLNKIFFYSLFIFATNGISLFNYLLIRLNVKGMKIVQIKKLVKITIVSILVNLLVVKKIISVKSSNMYQLVVNDMCQNHKR